MTYALPTVDKDFLIAYKEAKVNGEVEDWKGAMDEELNSLCKNSKLKLIKFLKRKKTIQYEWIFAKKNDSF